MTAAPFDTLKLAESLRDKAHFSQEQAEGITKAFSEAFQETVATKQDVSDLRQATQKDISDLKVELKADIAKVEKDVAILKWMIGFVLAFQGGIFAKLFFH